MSGRRTTARRPRRLVRRRKGAGFLDALRGIHNWVKSNKIISTVGNALAPVLPVAGTIGKVASAAGYGRRRGPGRPRRVGRPLGSSLRKHRVVRRRGGSLRSVLSKVHNFVKSNQLVSKGLTHFGHPKLASIASTAGYGRRRRPRRMIRHHGGANLLPTEQIAVPRF